MSEETLIRENEHEAMTRDDINFMADHEPGGTAEAGGDGPDYPEDDTRAEHDLRKECGPDYHSEGRQARRQHVGTKAAGTQKS